MLPSRVTSLPLALFGRLVRLTSFRPAGADAIASDRFLNSRPGERLIPLKPAFGKDYTRWETVAISLPPAPAKPQELCRGRPDLSRRGRIDRWATDVGGLGRSEAEGVEQALREMEAQT